MAFESGNIPKETLDYLESKKASSGHAGTFLVLGFLACLVLVSAVLSIPSVNNRVDKTSLASSANTSLPLEGKYRPDDLLAEAKQDMAAKNYNAALNVIAKLHDADSKNPIVMSIYNRATHEVQLADLRQARQNRILYARNYELKLLDAGGDYTVRAQGPNADLLNVTYVLINRPFVFKIQNDENLNTMWKGLGFKSVRLSDGFDSSWSYKLK